MILITLGSQKFQFDRLLKKIDQLVDEKIIKDKVFAQVGYSTYVPKNYEYKQFLDREEFLEYQSKADIIITHGGTGAIIGSIKKGKKVIAVPRLKKFGEHVDDHQLQLINQFKQLNLIYACDDCNDLDEALKKIEDIKFNSYQSNTNTLLDAIENYLHTVI